MILVLPKSQTFIQLCLLVVISASLVHKYSKYREEILEMAKFIRYLSCTSPIFFNASQFQIHSGFIVSWIQMPIILPQNICCTAYPRDFYIGRVNNKLFSFSTPIQYFSYQDGVLHGNYIGIAYIMLEYLRLVLLLIAPSIEGLEKVFMGCFTICRIIVYRASIILNAFDEMCHSIEFWIIESWSEQFCFDWTMVFKRNLCLVKPI